MNNQIQTSKNEARTLQVKLLYVIYVSLRKEISHNNLLFLSTPDTTDVRNVSHSVL